MCNLAVRTHDLVETLRSTKTGRAGADNQDINVTAEGTVSSSSFNWKSHACRKRGREVLEREPAIRGCQKGREDTHMSAMVGVVEVMMMLQLGTRRREMAQQGNALVGLAMAQLAR